MIDLTKLPSADTVLPTEYKTTCFIKNVVKAKNITVGDYTYYDDEQDPEAFEKNNVLFNYPEFGDRLVIGKFCAVASGATFVMGAANHRLGCATTYPFSVFGGAWAQAVPDHLTELPKKGDTVIGNDVWIGRESVVLPGVKIGDGAIVGAYSVVAKDVPAYAVAVGNPARVVKMRFDDEMIALLLALRWWDATGEELIEMLPMLTDPDLPAVKAKIRRILSERN